MATATVSIDSSTVAFSADTEGHEARLAAMALQGAIDNGRSSDGWPSDPAEQAIRCTCAALVLLMRRSGMYQLHGDMADLIEAYMTGHAHQFQGSESQSRDVLEIAGNDLVYSAETIAARFFAAATDAGKP